MPSSRPSSLPFPNTPQFQLSIPRVVLGIVAVVLVIGAWSSFYQVPANSVGVVQRFGAFHSITSPGLRFKLPFGIDEATVLETLRQMKLEFGYATPGATDEYQFAATRQEQEEEKNMVTGDLNAAVVEWVVQYHIDDPKSFAFNFYNPQLTLRALSESVMREVVGDRTIDEVLTVGRQEIEIKALEQLKKLTTNLNMGVLIDQIQLGNLNPPPQVQASFDEVNRAQQEKESMINAANGEYNRLVPRAKGEAEQKISEAEGYATERVNEAEGDATRFTALLMEYQKAPDVTKKRIYLETLGEILPTIPGKVIIDDKVPQFLPLMNLQQNLTPQPAPDATTLESNAR